MARTLTNLSIGIEPLGTWLGPTTAQPERSRFRAPWNETLNTLDRELRHLGAKNVVLRAFVTPQQLRIDNGLRAGARPSRPGIILAYDTRQGHFEVPCDRWNDWVDNLRAIALALESLRAVDRYGVTKRGEQYRGWAALPAPKAALGDIQTPEQAREFLGTVIGVDRVKKLHSWDSVREAQKLTHPDKGGSAEDFKKVMQCAKVLRAPPY